MTGFRQSFSDLKCGVNFGAHISLIGYWTLCWIILGHKAIVIPRLPQFTFSRFPLVPMYRPAHKVGWTVRRTMHQLTGPWILSIYLSISLTPCSLTGNSQPGGCHNLSVNLSLFWHSIWAHSILLPTPSLQYLLNLLIHFTGRWSTLIISSLNSSQILWINKRCI